MIFFVVSRLFSDFVRSMLLNVADIFRADLNDSSFRPDSAADLNSWKSSILSLTSDVNAGIFTGSRKACASLAYISQWRFATNLGHVPTSAHTVHTC